MSIKNCPRKIIVLIIILIGLSLSNSTFAQLGSLVSGANVYSPPSPNASALLRYANVPVDEHTGIPSVVLPIDQLSGRQISVPITLSYHASGIKVQDIASNVGLGFVLNAGGVVTRVMRGLPDESAAGFQYNGKKVVGASVDSVYLNATINNTVDSEPDLFYFNFLGHSGKVVIDTLGNSQYLPDQGIRVISHPIHNNPDSVHNAWVLKDLGGTTYIFGVDTSSQESSMVHIAGQPASKNITYTSSWYLAKIITPDGKETMDFQYNTGPVLSYTQYRSITTYLIHYDVTDKRKSLISGGISHHEDLSPKNTQTTDVSTIIQVLNPKYLSRIKNDMGWAAFSYNSRQDLVGGLALYQIKLFNVNDSSSPIKTYTFNQSYFISPHPKSPDDPDSKRLRLDCVYLTGRGGVEVKQLFVFTYNNQTLLPPRDSNEFDHWGYYTTLDNRASFPPVNLTLDQFGNYDDGFDQRKPDSARLKACILTRVRNLNGGYTNFTYEIDDYKFGGTTHLGGGLRIKTITENDSLGQVVPIVKRYVYTQDDGSTSGEIYNSKPYYIQGITNYAQGTVVKPFPNVLKYIGSSFKKPLVDAGIAADIAVAVFTSVTPVGIVVDVLAFVVVPVIADAWNFIFHRTHHYEYDSPPFAISSTPLNNLFDINGASVTYNQVSIINPDGGKTVDYYTGQQDYSDSLSVFRLNCLAAPVLYIYGNTGSFPPATSFDFERGLLKLSKAFDSNNNLVSQVTNTYQLSKRKGVVTGQRASVSGYATLQNGSFQVITYDVGFYKEIAENIQLTKSVTQLFDQANNGTSISNVHNYAWQPDYPTLLHSESTPRSDGKLLVNYYTYPMEYLSTGFYNDGVYQTDFLGDMVSHSMLGVPIERISALQDQSGQTTIIGGTVSRFKSGGLGLLDTVFSISASKPILLANFKFSNLIKGNLTGTYQPYNIDKSYIAKAFYQSYDSKNNLNQSQNFGESASSLIWGYNNDVPIAKVSNATIDRVAYTGFETNDQQFWSFNATGRDSSGLAKTGKIRYQLASGTVTTTANLPAGTYIISLWIQGAKPTISGASSDQSIVNGESDTNSWNFYMDRITLNAASHIALSGSGLIDEVRLYPQGAHMSTVSISPQVGTSSVNSQDDKVNSYDYDDLQRVKRERDDQYNIMKEYTYSNIAPVPCGITPDVWTGINPVCYTDQTGVVPSASNYSAVLANNLGALVCAFSRIETSYQAKVNFTVSYSDNTTYSNSIILKNGDQVTAITLPTTGKSAESAISVGIDTVVNMTDNYAVTWQRFQNRQRARDGYVEANTLTGGSGIYVPPVQSASGCSLLFTNKPQTGFYKNDCSNGNGSVVDYTVAGGLYSASTQSAADSLARSAGQIQANLLGNCSATDTTFVGTAPYCLTGSVDSGTPSLSNYSVSLNALQPGMLIASIFRASSEAVHDATVVYAIHFKDGSVATYTALMYKNQQVTSVVLPLAGYTQGSVLSVTLGSVTYSPLIRRAFNTRQRLLNGVADGYSETNSAGRYYLSPIEDPAACGTWYYSTPQTNFYKADCTPTGTLVAYTSSARTDSSMVSQAYADALARVRAQAYVNTSVACTAPPVNYVSFYLNNSTGTGYQVDFSDGISHYTFDFKTTGPEYVQVPQGTYTVNIYPTGVYTNRTIELGSRTPVSAPRATFYSVNVSTGSSDLSITVY